MPTTTKTTSRKLTPVQEALIEKTRARARKVLEALEHTCNLARISIDGAQPESAAAHLLGVAGDLKPHLPGLRRAMNASRSIP